MSDVRAELVFVAGPQEGTSMVITANVAVAGRSPTAELHLAGSYASRRHMRFELTGDGVVVENLSANGTIINGKKYKSGKRVLLETGDVLGVGIQTEMLFVAAGDDPVEALAAYRSKREAELSARVVEQTQTEPPTVESDQTTEAPAGAEPTKPLPLPETPSPVAKQLSAEQRTQRAKLARYAVFGAVYVVVLVAVVFMLSRLKDTGDGAAEVPRLSDKQIERALLAPLAKQRNPTKAAEALNKALELYSSRHYGSGALYGCVKNFKLHLAYRKRPDFDNVRHERMFQRARDQLIELVGEKYRSAYGYERAGNYARAQKIYNELLKIVPEREPDDPVLRQLVKNIFDHLSSISRRVNPS